MATMSRLDALIMSLNQMKGEHVRLSKEVEELAAQEADIAKKLSDARYRRNHLSDAIGELSQVVSDMKAETGVNDGEA